MQEKNVLVKRIIAIIVCCLCLLLVFTATPKSSNVVKKGRGVNAEIESISQMGNLLDFYSQRNSQMNTASTYSSNRLNADFVTYNSVFNNDRISNYGASSNEEKEYSSFTLDETTTARISSTTDYDLYRKYRMASTKTQTYYHSYLVLNSSLTASGNGGLIEDKRRFEIDMEVYLVDAKIYVRVNKCSIAGGDSQDEENIIYAQVQGAFSDLIGKWTDMTDVSLFFELISEISQQNYDMLGDFAQLFRRYEDGEKVFIQKGKKYTVSPDVNKSFLGIPSYIEDDDFDMDMVFDLSNRENPKFELKLGYDYSTPPSNDNGQASYSVKAREMDSAIFSNINNTKIDVNVSKASSGVEWFEYWDTILG